MTRVAADRGSADCGERGEAGRLADGGERVEAGRLTHAVTQVEAGRLADGGERGEAGRLAHAVTQVEAGCLAHAVTQVEAGRTVGQILAHEMAVSRTLIRRLKSRSLITVNGAFARTNRRLCEGDVVRVELGPLAEGVGSVVPDPVPIKILYEDSSFIAIDKPVGMIIHPSQPDSGGTAANALAHYFAATGQIARIHPISRLDRDTTGVVLFAKDPYSCNALAGLMRSGGMQKEYLALTLGEPRPACGAINLPIGRVEGSIVLRGVRCGGKPAKTYYRTLWTGGAGLACGQGGSRCGPANAVSLIKLCPETGRTHQIRVHMLAIGCPLLGDGLYGTRAAYEGSLVPKNRAACLPQGSVCDAADAGATAADAAPTAADAAPTAADAVSTFADPGSMAADAAPTAAGAAPTAADAGATAADAVPMAAAQVSLPPMQPLMRRQALHAWRVSFTHPATGADVSIAAPPPEDFLCALEALGAPKWL